MTKLNKLIDASKILLLSGSLIAGLSSCNKKQTRSASRQNAPDHCNPLGGGSAPGVPGVNNPVTGGLQNPAGTVPVALALVSPNELPSSKLSIDHKNYGLTYSSATITCEVDNQANMCVYQMYDINDTANLHPKGENQELWYTLTAGFQEIPQIGELGGKNVAFRSKHCVEIQFSKEAQPEHGILAKDVILLNMIFIS